MKNALIGLVILMLLTFQCSLNLPKPKKQFVDLSIDTLIHPEYIQSFLNRLNQLTSNKSESLQVMHIGDSHIQMGYFSGAIRNELQHKFGGEGIGFFFPNGLCKGYNPVGMDVQSSSNWTCEKITNLESTIPLGIVGMAMQTTDAVSSVEIGLKAKKTPVHTIQLFHKSLGGKIKITCDSATITTTYFSPNSEITTITLNQPVEKATVVIEQSENPIHPFVLYGMSINESMNGVRYHTFGVSGGQYKYFANNTPLFAEQLNGLKPDLLIISLGSNDAYGKELTQESYEELILKLIQTVRTESPKTEILLTTPPDLYYKKQKPASGDLVYTSILNIGNAEKCTIWDFRSVMGGDNSMKKWQKKKLGSKDGLHLTRDGYILQGQLFNLALVKTMNSHFFRDDYWQMEIEKSIIQSFNAKKKSKKHPKS